MLGGEGGGTGSRSYTGSRLLHLGSPSRHSQVVHLERCSWSSRAVPQMRGRGPKRGWL